ncbi:MAG: DUF1329 domain-containing protein, partial [Burkholderiales bacterium]|nr:DUF1329 domain-containing protein [Burkholderiales bacterium]
MSISRQAPASRPTRRVHAPWPLLLAATLATGAWAGDVDRLGKDLTVVGAEAGASKDGLIPAFANKPDLPLPGWTWGKVRSQYARIKDEKPLFTIDASNVDKYADKMTPGQVALVKQLKGYRMDIYPTHRNCYIPPEAAAKTRENALEAKMAADGSSLAHAKAGGVPFPIPKTGAEAMWNHKLRLSGVGFEFKNGGSTLSPRRGDSNFVYYSWELSQFFPWGAKEAKNVEDNG